jgi:hypothetical protein
MKNKKNTLLTSLRQWEVIRLTNRYSLMKSEGRLNYDEMQEKGSDTSSPGEDLLI